MAQPLSFMFNVHAPSAKQVAEGLTTAFGVKAGADPHPLPNIVHYLWLIQLPDQVGQAPDTKCMMLTTVYDEEFEPYVKDLARAAPAVFDAILSQIIGMEKMVPVLQHLNEYAAFIKAHDLTGGGVTPTFKQNYTETVMQIWALES
jgi:hypothetical protein